MTDENIANFLERNKLEQLLYDLSKGVANIAEKQLSDEQVDLLCQKGYAFKISDTKLIGVDYLTKKIFSSIKYNHHNRNEIETNNIEGYLVSPEFVHIVLNRLVNEGLVIKEGNTFKPNLEMILSEEEIRKYAKHRIDAITLGEVIRHFGFFPTTKNRYGWEEETNASIQCQKVLGELVQEGCLIKDQHKIDTYFWNHRYTKEV